MLQMSTIKSSQILRARHHSNPNMESLFPRNVDEAHSINHADSSRDRSGSPQPTKAEYQDESDDEPLIFEETMSESLSTFGRTTMFYNQRQQLRTALKNFFTNPFEKYRYLKLQNHVFQFKNDNVLVILLEF